MWRALVRPSPFPSPVSRLPRDLPVGRPRPSTIELRCIEQLAGTRQPTVVQSCSRAPVLARTAPRHRFLKASEDTSISSRANKMRDMMRVWRTHQGQTHPSSEPSHVTSPINRQDRTRRTTKQHTSYPARQDSGYQRLQLSAGHSTASNPRRRHVRCPMSIRSDDPNSFTLHASRKNARSAVRAQPNTLPARFDIVSYGTARQPAASIHPYVLRSFSRTRGSGSDSGAHG